MIEHLIQNALNAVFISLFFPPRIFLLLINFFLLVFSINSQLFLKLEIQVHFFFFFYLFLLSSFSNNGSVVIFYVHLDISSFSALAWLSSGFTYSLHLTGFQSSQTELMCHPCKKLPLQTWVRGISPPTCTHFSSHGKNT